MMEKPPQEEPAFQGFEQANTTPVPDVLFDELLAELSGSELKVLLYIIRRTKGFKKDSDAISLSQFQHGITARDGKVLDRGCGIKRRQTIIDTLSVLEKKGYVISLKSKSPQKDDATTVYQIKFKQSEVVSKPDYPQGGSFKTGLPSFKTGLGGSFKTGLGVVSESDHGVVSESDPQETVIQETVIQDTLVTQNKNVTILASADQPTESPVSFAEDQDFKRKPRTPKPRTTEPKPAPILSEKAQVVWAFWLTMPWNTGIPPRLTETAARHCESLSKAEITLDIMFKVRNFAEKNDQNNFYKGKSWELGHMVAEYPRWKSTQYQASLPQEQEAKQTRPKSLAELNREKMMYAGIITGDKK